MMTREELVEAILSGKKMLSRLEAELLGIEWPLKQGWRKKIRQAADVQERRTGSHTLPLDKTGFILRGSMGKVAHRWVNGDALCRSVRWQLSTKYRFSEIMEDRALCVMCKAVMDKDPSNNRSQRARKRSAPTTPRTDFSLEPYHPACGYPPWAEELERSCILTA